MYERWLDKSVSPGFEDLLAYSGESHVFWRELDAYLKETFSAQQQIRFPYGNKYGWSSKYSIKKKHLCDAFAEKGAFSLHFRLNNREIDLLYADLTDYAKEICDKNILVRRAVGSHIESARKRSWTTQSSFFRQKRSLFDKETSSSFILFHTKSSGEKSSLLFLSCENRFKCG